MYINKGGRWAVLMIMLFIMASIVTAHYETYIPIEEIPDVSIFLNRGQSTSVLNDVEGALQDLPSTTIYKVVYTALGRICLTPESRVEITYATYSRPYYEVFLKQHLLEGRMPVDETEVIIGEAFKDYFELKVGEVIEDVLMPGHYREVLDIDSAFESKRIVGVIRHAEHNLSVLSVVPSIEKPGGLLLYMSEEADYAQLEAKILERVSAYSGIHVNMTYKSKKVVVQRRMAFWLIWLMPICAVAFWITFTFSRQLALQKNTDEARKLLKKFFLLSPLIFLGLVLMNYWVFFGIHKSAVAKYGYQFYDVYYTGRVLMVQALFFVGVLVVTGVTGRLTLRKYGLK